MKTSHNQTSASRVGFPQGRYISGGERLHNLGYMKSHSETHPNSHNTHNFCPRTQTKDYNHYISKTINSFYYGLILIPQMATELEFFPDALFNERVSKGLQKNDAPSCLPQVKYAMIALLPIYMASPLIHRQLFLGTHCPPSAPHSLLLTIGIFFPCILNFPKVLL